MGIAMTSSSLLLPLVLLLGSSAGGLFAGARAAADGHGGLKHIHLYMHEILSGTNATGVTVTLSPLGVNASFGLVGVVDIELRNGSDPKSSMLIGRYQGIFAFAGLVSPPGMLTTGNLVFTAGEHRGSTLTVVGTIQSFSGTIERAVVGGTGGLRMARGYCVVKVIANPTLVSVVYEVDVFLQMHA